MYLIVLVRIAPSSPTKLIRSIRNRGISRNRSNAKYVDSGYLGRNKFNLFRRLGLYPVERALRLAKFASDENDINEFRI